MSLLVAWDNEAQTILRIDVAGQWTWKEYDGAIDQAYTMIQEVDHSVDLIINLTDTVVFPQVQSMRHFQRMLTQRPGNLDMMIAAGGDSFVSGLFASFLQTRLADTLPQARAMLVNRARLGTLPYHSTELIGN
jgi:hypothetical protein